MTTPQGADQARFLDALVSEIKAEMGRRGIKSSRALASLIGWTSQYTSMRLDGGNSKTGQRVTISVTDLAAISSALGVDPMQLWTNATNAAAQKDSEK